MLEQRFENRYAETLHVTYRMPLPADGAVSGYAFELAGRTVAGRVERKRAAREQFERAVASGRTAALLEQERADVFQIATRFTSWIAIDEARTVTGPSRHEVMPQALPYGTTAAAFGLRQVVELEAGEVAGVLAEFDDVFTELEAHAVDVGEEPAVRVHAFYADSPDEDEDDSEIDDWSAEASASSLLLDAPSFADVELEQTLEEPIPEPARVTDTLDEDRPSHSTQISLSQLRRVSQPEQVQLEPPRTPEPLQPPMIPTELKAPAPVPEPAPAAAPTRWFAGR